MIRVVNKYQIHQELGRGTYSVVYYSTTIPTGTPVALKEMKEFENSNGFPQTTAREIRFLQQLNHPNVIKLLDVVTSEKYIDGTGALFLVFEYMPHDLQSLLYSPVVSTTISFAQIKGYLFQFLVGINYLHKTGIVHRDLKPSNLLINNKGYLKIADFGLARRASKSECNNNVITLNYRPPELILGNGFYGTEIDMWSVGCIIFECLFKRPPFTGSSELEILTMIYGVCGSPDESDARQFRRWEEYRPNKPFPCRLVEFLERWKCSMDQEEMLSKLITVDRKARATAEQVLGMNFFKSEPTPLLPWQMVEYNSTLEVHQVNMSPTTPIKSPPIITFV
ncbi:cyclin-dependent kinase C-1, putative [Entamoeba invadens IP1]|uniref:cyclin-dependent kinase n=1 Tax=Entamoeba invadens IP1 TaxID=370355 RepID=A0A0A1U393_ENTIV|nr:cyclin-dependent kinase C-1, putative [Entamoeba invadens IP1]ELP87213.1 cyclin-dependent kinase C-1, putative [Entamoeba invadens IP1]|eukprot:XP_004253984.1 cyclin-dependent kinase C-1, putative [Entamoeba invadens IP1]